MKRNSEVFLQKYRILEGLLEKRYEGEDISSSSVVIEYIRDDDSEPVRVDLDLLRQIRNILSHNAGSDGSAVAEPSDEMLARLDAIIQYVQRPRYAREFGTPAEKIFSVHPNELLMQTMRSMQKKGYSHVPICNGKKVVGILSIKCVFDYLAENGANSLKEEMRISDLKERTRIDRTIGERYMFVPADTSIISVRNAFSRHTEKNSRLSTVFVTQNGSPEEELICMLTPWDVLSDQI